MTAPNRGSPRQTSERSSPGRSSTPQGSGSSRKQISAANSTSDNDVEMGRKAAKNENPRQQQEAQPPQDGSKSKSLPKSKKDTRRIAMISAAVLAFLVLVIGLSVGLTQRNKSNNNSIPSDSFTLGEGTGVGSISSPRMYSAPSTDLDDGLLKWRIQSFGTGVLSRYDGCDELRSDLAEAGAYLANVVIRRNSRYNPSYGGGGFTKDAVEEEAGIALDAPMAMESEASPTESAKGSQADFAADEAEDDGGADGETDFGTNNQVEGVDEGDMVKSDGTFVFAAYGDRVIQFDTFGRKISETIMPAPDFDEDSCGDHYYVDDDYEVEVEELVDFDGRTRRRKLSEFNDKKLRGAIQKRHRAQNRHQSRQQQRRKALSIAEDAYWGCWRPEARIESLLLENDRLIVVVSGYEPNYRYNAMDRSQQPILGDVGTTKVRVYDVNSLIPNKVIGESSEKPPGHPSQLRLVAARDLPGHYASKGGRSVGNRAYLVSNNYVDTWYHFQRHFDRWQSIYDGLSNEAYIEAATAYAMDKVIPSFTDRLLLELMEQGDEDLLGSCSHVQQLSLYQTGDIDAAANHWWDGGVFSGLSQITSFDIGQTPSATFSADVEPMLRIEKSVAFVPSSWSTTIYATKDMLFLASQGYDEHPKSRSGFIPSTFILGFDLGDGPAKGVSVGKVPGTVLNQFSIDMYEDHLRVATTTWSDWVCPVQPLAEQADDIVDEVDEPGEDQVIVESTSSTTTTTSTTSSGTIDTMPVEPIEDERIFCRGDRFRGPQNQITILDVAGVDSVMHEAGQLGGLGKPGESIYAVRFIGWRAFVVTFERTDPFYTIDLSVPTEPRITGELEVPGYSNYLHPTEDENVLIAVGENADEFGRALGVQVSLFGVADFEHPELLARYDIENREDQYSSSEVAWDHRAFRYLRQTKQVIIPAEVHGNRGEDSFDGFYILDVNKYRTNMKERITLRHRVNLAPDQEDMWSRCYSSARLAARSMVFSGDALLLKNHAVESHRLDEPPNSKTFLWRLEMEDPTPESDNDKRKGCSYWW